MGTLGGFPSPGVDDEQVFQRLDHFLDQLRLRGMHAVMTLNNYWEWPGGMAQYVSWSDGSSIPHRLDPGGSHNVYIRYVGRFYQVENLMAAQGAITGDNFWTWACEAHPPSLWTGDPPHETPGWRSVNDQDASTLGVLSAHAAALHTFAAPVP